MKRAIFALIGAATLAACTPSDVPSTGQITRNAAQANVPIVDLTPQAVATIGTVAPPAGLAPLGHSPFRNDMIRPGDVIEVSVLDTAEGGIFSAASVGRADLGTFTVSPSGTISVPFAGVINVAGSSTVAAQRTIASRLRETALDPQAAVTVVREPSDVVTVQGGVAAPGAVPLTARGERVLDAVAQSGGAQGDPASTTVTVLRGTRRATGLLQSLIADPRQNVPLQPGDTVIVGGPAASVLADGALNSPGAIPFEPGALSLQDAIGRAGGIASDRGALGNVYVFRRQAPGESFILRERDGSLRTVTGDVIVRANFADPVTQLNAAAFQMRGGDILYVGEKPLVRFARFLRLARGASQAPASEG